MTFVLSAVVMTSVVSVGFCEADVTACVIISVTGGVTVLLSGIAMLISGKKRKQK